MRREHFEFTLLVMPRRSAVCERLLAEGGVLADVAVRELPLDWVALDEDLLSLEMPTAFKVGGADGGWGSVLSSFLGCVDEGGASDGCGKDV